MIKLSSLNNLRILDFFQVTSNIASHLDGNDLKSLKLEEVSASFKAALSSLDEALKPLRASADTQKLNELDARRDRALVGLNAFLKSFAHFPNAAKVTAASHLKAELDKYGKSPQTLPLREETALITNVLQDFAKPENEASISELAAETWIAELKAANTDFETLYNSRTQENSAIEVGKTKAERQKTQSALSLLIKTINARMLLDGETAYKALADAMDFEIKQAKTAYKSRQAIQTVQAAPPKQ